MDIKKLQEIRNSILNAEPGKLADTVQKALEEIDKGDSGLVWSLSADLVMAAFGNIDKRIQQLESSRR
jgi:hypothetical protein